MLALGACGAWALRRWGKVDATTSFFAMAVGGASEMAAQAERYGGRVDRVSAAHSLRISLVAVLVPLALRAAGVEGTDLYQPALQSFDARGFAVLVAVTGGAAIVLARTGAPNVFMIGPLLVTAALTASGHGWSALPGAVVDAGQLLLGIALGSRYAPDFFRAAPRYLAVVAALTVVYLGLGALLGWALAAAALLPLPTALLATTPGGIGEMALTAKVLKLGAPIVTAFHAVRMVLVVLLVGPLFRAQRAWSRRSTR
jgi:membrane AbrB-like protein